MQKHKRYLAEGCGSYSKVSSHYKDKVEVGMGGPHVIAFCCCAKTLTGRRRGLCQLMGYSPSLREASNSSGQEPGGPN